MLSRPTCPGCHQPEDVIVICRSCAYVYKDSAADSIKAITICLSIVFGLVWFGCTLMAWAGPLGEKPTLIGVLTSQATFVWDLLHRIW